MRISRALEPSSDGLNPHPSPQAPAYAAEPGSFRDRHGRIVYGSSGGVFRMLSARALEEWRFLQATNFFRNAMNGGRIVETRQVDREWAPPSTHSEEPWSAALRHDRIPFVSYPYEWPFGMLKDAALLHLDLLLEALEENLILKDASAYNVQWIGSRPVFIDVLSFERCSLGEPWAGYRQFCRMFLNPLMLQAYKGLPFQPWLRGSLEGVETEHMNRLFTARELLKPGVFAHVFLQAKLQARYSNKDREIKADLRNAGFHKNLIRTNARRLHRLVSRLRMRDKHSEWSDYENSHHYSTSDYQKKLEFVGRASGARRWDLIWDLGCNTGAFSRIAAEHARYTVAMDSDSHAVELLYQDLKAEGRETILPLTLNLLDASPNQGWRGLERKNLPERGKPDLILCLALMHHACLTGNVPLWEFLEWLASLGGDLIIEFVSQRDPMARKLLKNKKDPHGDYNRGTFDRSLNERFDVIWREPLGCGTRELIFARNSGK